MFWATEAAWLIGALQILGADTLFGIPEPKASKEDKVAHSGRNPQSLGEVAPPLFTKMERHKRSGGCVLTGDPCMAVTLADQ